LSRPDGPIDAATAIHDIGNLIPARADVPRTVAGRSCGSGAFTFFAGTIAGSVLKFPYSAALEVSSHEQFARLRYRKLALQEPDKENAQLLQLLAMKRIGAFYARGRVDTSQLKNRNPVNSRSQGMTKIASMTPRSRAEKHWQAGQRAAAERSRAL